MSLEKGKSELPASNLKVDDGFDPSATRVAIDR
jgi:hypothetical protein